MRNLVLPLTFVAQEMGPLVRTDKQGKKRTVCRKSKRIVAFLGDENERPVFYLFGWQAQAGRFSEIRSYHKDNPIPVFDQEMISLFKRVWKEGEVKVDMTFAVDERPVYPSGMFWNTHVIATWYTGKQRKRLHTSIIKPWAVYCSHTYTQVNTPQWKVDGKFIQIMGGRMVESIKGMLDSYFRDKAHSIYRSVPDPKHQGFCTRCSWFRSDGYERDAAEDKEGIDYFCALNKFVPFNSLDITTEMKERCFVTEDNKSSDADALWVWEPEETTSVDRALALHEWVDIGIHMDEFLGLRHCYEFRFSNFERYYDDMMWIDRIYRQYGFEGITDMDAAIREVRDAVLKKASNHWAKKFPEFAHLFKQTASYCQDDAYDKLVAPEIGETTHKVPLMALLNNKVFKPCSCGIQYKWSHGKLVCYLYQGEPHRNDPLPVFDNFLLNIGMGVVDEDEDE